MFYLYFISWLVEGSHLVLLKTQVQSFMINKRKKTQKFFTAENNVYNETEKVSVLCKMEVCWVSGPRFNTKGSFSYIKV